MEQPATDRLQRRLLAVRVYYLGTEVRKKLQRAAELGIAVAPDAAGVPDVLFRCAEEIADGQEFLPSRGSPYRP
jgi:hypothetical protein